MVLAIYHFLKKNPSTIDVRLDSKYASAFSE